MVIKWRFTVRCVREKSLELAGILCHFIREGGFSLSRRGRKKRALNAMKDFLIEDNLLFLQLSLPAFGVQSCVQNRVPFFSAELCSGWEGQGHMPEHFTAIFFPVMHAW